MSRQTWSGLVAALTLGMTLPARAGGPMPEKTYFDDQLKQAAPAGAAGDGTAAGKLGTGAMRRANRVAAELLEERMKQDRPADLRLLREAGAADVIVVKGSYDRVQDVLRAVKVKHVVIPPHLVARLPLMSTQTLMINCPGRLSRAGIAKVRRFVKTGGHLITTDWALSLLPRAFPGYVARGGRNTANDVVQVHIHDDSDPMLQHVRASREKPRWWLESSSYPIRILDPKKVRVLISSKEMAKKYGFAPIAVAFRYDDGKVLHMTSHFFLQQAKLLSQRERARGSSFAQSAGIRGAAVTRLKAKGLDSVRAGELNSAYSIQQVTANVLVGKQRANRKLLQKYGKRARRAISLGSGAGAGAKPLKDAKVDKDYRLRVLKKRGARVKVRDLFGREGWIDEAELY